jgi:hypothetical protein
MNRRFICLILREGYVSSESEKLVGVGGPTWCIKGKLIDFSYKRIHRADWGICHAGILRSCFFDWHTLIYFDVQGSLKTIAQVKLYLNRTNR